MAPTSYYNYSGGSTGQRLVLATSLLLLLFATAFGNNFCVGLASLPYLWSRM
jgi:hypothetical protein